MKVSVREGEGDEGEDEYLSVAVLPIGVETHAGETAIRLGSLGAVSRLNSASWELGG